MTERSRKIFTLSLGVLALAIVHFFIAYQLIVTANPPGLNLAAAVFIVMGLLQVGLGLFGTVVAFRRS